MAHTKRMHGGTCEKETDQRRHTRENIWRLTNGDRLEKIYDRTPMEMKRWEHITGKGSLVKMAHRKRMHSGTCEKEADQRRQTRENIWPHSNENEPVVTCHGKGSLVKMAHTKRMHSGTCEKETDQRRQTRENIWPHTNGNVPGRNM
ncbi:hypothetical protein M514_08600 [Trichuris suis]|uniref:Uncharacterized protein n=1 Tax=Trichuris suis TaxID=68888 RepID=A0A085N1T9_9BILA|nr:hypothetical protein M514_08600 [Trichuris suis]